MRIRIVGAGVMGRGIAQWAAAAGHTVELADARPESVEEAVSFIGQMLERAVAKQRITRAEAVAAAARLLPLDTPLLPAAPDGGDAPELVVEAVREDLATKVELLRGLEEVLPEKTVFATNTSSLSVTEIAAGLRDPSRLAGLHFFNPVPLMKIAEVVPGAATRPGIPPALVDLVRGCGHQAVVVADTPGFLVNHAGRGLITEALALLEESVSDPVGIDRIARDVLGLRMGPFELTDLTGLDVTSAVIDTIWRGFRHSERLRPSYLTPGRVSAGLLGRKTGRGFYDYAPGAGAVRPEDPVDGDAGRPMLVVGDGPRAVELRGALAEGGATVLREPADAVSSRAVVLVPTWGTTVAAAVHGLGLPADRTLGVDPLSLATGRRVLAMTPASAPDTVRDAAAVLARPAVPGADGAPTVRAVSIVGDTPGSVAQRLLASIVSVAASIAERSIAEPSDIDLAVTAGLGYPTGPLAWGDRIGAGAMLELQRALLDATGDPRYRPTRWLVERAQLGLPLTERGAVPPHSAG
ncbi:3-hydroxyacyl-CoA dehydrogenase NAD-binding domain-containing protein [Streptomyces sp. TP-A0874]|uniref:3-hydroxyacyl-CoA dehydrogenase NAD-binding domain-containing protein n=1 Tax=Streptomyces sp. TP-A0874 TaxID=549819 RepID=UPI00085353CA|nr:3-hydroxyacyl-CoA dehydrogenase NAD-binding domain-containing protein [Streptomyces sp. TP-A0874]